MYLARYALRSVRGSFCPLRSPLYAYRRGISSHITYQLTPAFDSRYTGVRYVRSRTTGGSSNDNHEQSHKADSQESESNQSHENGEQKSEQEKPKVDPATVKKLRMYVLAVGCISFVTSFILLAQIWKDGSGKMPGGITNDHLTSHGIDFQTFVEAVLKTGEVKEIVFFPNNARAVAILHDGAVVNGKRVTDPVVVVSYSQNAQQFWADVRKEEANIGISLSDGVKISLYQGVSTFRVIEMLLGVMIIAWLGTQYGRLLRKSILEKKAKAAAASKGTPPN